jgi:hypothetical protein
MKKLLILLVCTSQISNAEVDKICVRLFSETRIETKGASYQEGIKVEYGYKFEGDYVTKNETEILTIEGIAQMETFYFSKGEHPFIGKPFYIAILNKGKLSGSVIKCYMGDMSGFYLIQGLEIDQRGYLKNDSGKGLMSPLTSKPFNKLFQNIIAEVKTETK